MIIVLKPHEKLVISSLDKEHKFIERRTVYINKYGNIIIKSEK